MIRIVPSRVHRALAGLLATMFAAGCQTPAMPTPVPSPTPSPSGEAAPEIPPASTMVMDFSDFQAADGTARIIARENFGWAAGNVIIWNAILTVTLAVPVGAFVESFNHEPTQEADGTWVWAYDATVEDIVYSAKLRALAVGGDIEWNMLISKEGEFSDVNWFSGVSNLLGTEGAWTLNKDPDNLTPVLGIEWHRAPSAGTADIKYTNIIPDDPENGGFIFFGADGGDPFDASYQIFNKGADNTTDIEWNRETIMGRVRDPQHFSDDLWHCWDEKLDDEACPNAAG